MKIKQVLPTTTAAALMAFGVHVHAAVGDLPSVPDFAELKINQVTTPAAQYATAKPRQYYFSKTRSNGKPAIEPTALVELMSADVQAVFGRQRQELFGKSGSNGKQTFSSTVPQELLPADVRAFFERHGAPAPAWNLNERASTYPSGITQRPQSESSPYRVVGVVGI